MERKETVWNRYFVLACIVALVTGICMRMLDSNLAPFADAAWSSKTLGGYLTSIFNVGSITMAFLSGRLVDLKGRRNCLIVGALVFGLPTFACALWPTPAVTLTVRFVQGVGKGVVNVAAAAIVSDVVPRSRMGEGMGLFGLGNTLSTAFGPMLGLALTAGGNFTTMFLVCAALYTSVAVIGVGIDYEKKLPAAAPAASSPAEEGQPEKEYRGVWKLIERKAILPSLNYTICFASCACVLVFVTVYAQEILELSSTQIGFFYTVSAGTMLLIRLFGGRLADRYSALAMLVPGHLALGAMLVILTFFAKGNYPLFLLAGGLYGIGNAAIMPTLNAVAVVDSPKGRNGTANATFYFMMDFGVLFGSAVFGAVIDAAPTAALGYRQMYLASMGICALSLLMSVVFFNNRARARRREKP